MRFDQPAGQNPIDQCRILTHPTTRIEGAAKVTGTAPYAYERNDKAPNAAYGVVVGSAIAVGKIRSIDDRQVRAVPGVLGVITYKNAGKLGKSKSHTARLLAGPDVQHFDQAVALVVAETFEQARDAARLLRVEYAASQGKYELSKELDAAITPKPEPFGGPPDAHTGNFDKAFAEAPVKVDATYTTAHQSHAMMEPHATIASWEGERLHLWTSNQMIAWAVRDTAQTLKIKRENIHVSSPHIGGGFGGKLWIRSEAVLAALAARQLGRPVKVALTRQQVFNNTTHRSATVQRVRLGATPDGKLQAIAHDTWSGDLPGGKPERGSAQTRLLYAGPHRRTTHRLATLNLTENNAMRAPGEAVGHLSLEVAMDELAEKLEMDPVELRILNDIQYDPAKGPSRPFSSRKLVECLRHGAERFGWNKRNPRPGQVRDGNWLVGVGVASALRDSPALDSAARVKLDARGRITVETDMTDIGTGSYTLLAQTAAEVMGVSLDQIDVRLADSNYPVSCGSGGQFGGNSSASGVYAACMLLRNKLALLAGYDTETSTFRDGRITSRGQSRSLAELAGSKGLVATDKIEYGDMQKKFALASFGAHFVEVGVHAVTGEIRVRRMTGVFACGRILNPKAARSQLLGAMTMGVGAALMEELVVDHRYGYFVNHDLAEYHVPVHADIPAQDIVMLPELDDKSSPLKGKGVGELGICGVGAAVANAVYNATGVRVRSYPITLEKVLDQLPAV